MDKYINTILYLNCLREVLSVIIPEKKNEILNELTEYQLLYLVKYGKFTDRKHSLIGERLLTENLNLYLVKNLDFLNEVLDENQVMSLSSLIPLSEYYLSSSSTVLKELKEKHVLSIFLEQTNENQSQQRHHYEWRTDPETGDKLLVDVTANRVIKRVPGETDAEKLQKIMQKAMALSGTLNSITAAGSSLGKIIDYAKEKGKSGSTTVMNIVRNIGTKIGYANLGYAALAAAAIYGATKLYKNYLTKAGRACNHLSGSEKDDCIRKFKADGIRAQISDLQRASSGCNKSSNPAQCKMVVQNKIDKLKHNLAQVTNY